MLTAAKAAAPATVYMTDLLPERLDVARRCGADWCRNPRRDDVATVIAERAPFGLDVVFECSGDPAAIDQALDLLTPGGTLMQVGIPPTAQVSFDLHRMRVKELVVRNVRRQKDCVEPAIGLIGRGLVDTRPMLTHRYPLDRIVEAFELVAGYRDGVIKAVLDLSGAR